MGAGFSIVARGSASADVYIYEDIGAGWFGGVTAKQFADELKAIGKVETINTHINSNGGDVFDGMAIYNQLTQHSAKVITHIDGVAASIASVIAMAGDEIKISESGFIMIHNAAGVVGGEAGEMRKMADLLDKVSGSIADVYAERTKQPVDRLRAMMDEETWFTGQEALENGFADSMVMNLHIAARLDPEKHKFKNPPRALINAAAPVAHVITGNRPVFDIATLRVASLRARMALSAATPTQPA